MGFPGNLHQGQLLDAGPWQPVAVEEPDPTSQQRWNQVKVQLVNETCLP